MDVVGTVSITSTASHPFSAPACKFLTLPVKPKKTWRPGQPDHERE